jgi:non-heme chloroperoxidase
VTILGHSGGCKIILTYLELYGDSRLRAIVFSDDSPCHLRDGIFSADQALAAIDAFQGPDAIGFSKGFSDQFLTDDAEESAKEAFYREGLKLPRPYMAKLFRWAAFGDWWDAYASVKVPTLVIGGRVSKVPVKIAQGIHEAVPGSSFVVFEADEGGGHAMFWEGPQKYNDSLRTFMRSS